MRAALVLAAVAAAVPTACTSPARSAAAAAPDGPARERVRLTLGAWLGTADGQLQTPRGGAANTTSPSRPTLDELGLEGSEVMPTLDLALALPGLGLHLDGTRSSRSGTGRLAEALTSQGIAFPAGAATSAELDLDLWRLGVRPAALQVQAGGWTLAPELGTGWVHFDYRLASPSAAESVDRAYSFGFPYLGLALARRWDRLAFDAELAGAAGVNGVSFVDLGLELALELARHGGSRAALFLGWRGAWLRRIDGQEPEQNEPSVRLGAFAGDPWMGLAFGLRIGLGAGPAPPRTGDVWGG